jgi:glycosyltransferase involved in cell wall biosynthesis
MLNKTDNITIVIPAFNEVRTIEKIINKIRKRYNNILVVLAKKSNDGTLNVIKKLKVKYIIDSGLGKGAAIRLAIKTVKSDIMVFIDADGSHNPNDIKKLVLPIIQNKSDLVIGSRVVGGSDEFVGTMDCFFRLFFNIMICLILNFRFKQKISDYENGFRAIRVSVAKKLNLKENTFTIEQEMAIKTMKKGYRIMEVSAHEYNGGKSSYSIWKVGPRFLYQILRDII